jgi:peroxiredoxin
MAFSTKYTLTLASLSMLLACGGGQTNNGQAAGAANQPQQSTSGNEQAAQQAQQPLMMGKEPAAAIPDFSFYVLKSGIRFEKSDIKPADKHVFVLFDPSCSYCQHEAADISKNYDQVKNVNFYFISMNDPALMSTFFERFAPALEGKENVHLLYDRNVEFVNKFHIPTQYPATYIYDNKGVLKTYWNGAKSEADLVKALTN